MQLIKITLEFCTADNQIETWTLEGDEARKWKEWTDGVCVHAELHGSNPDWNSLQWVKRRDGEPANEGGEATEADEDEVKP